MSNWLTSTPIAHRGLHSNDKHIPENSMKAFQKALEKGLPIELDIHLTGDEELIVFHDDNFKRMTGNNKNVYSTAWNEIKEYTILETNEKVPLFNQVLELIDGKVPLLIETKNFSKPGLLEQKLYETLKVYKGEYALQSFNPFSISWFRHNMPGIRRGQLAGKFKDDEIPFYFRVILKNLMLNVKTRPDFINYNIDDLPYLPVQFFHKTGIPLLSWTVGSNEQLAKAKAICDNFVFEHIPAELVLS